jgi:RNA 2',3'-cyclic 3'-phosphodiesterase
MIRAFAAIALPAAVRSDLAILATGLPVERIVAPEALHLTLVFLGEVPAPVLEDVDSAFGVVVAPAFKLSLRGLGVFGGAKPRIVYVGAAPDPALSHLHRKLVTAARSAGVDLESRRFVPHVTLARLNRPPEDRVRLERFVALRGDYSAPSFTVEGFGLYRSQLGSGGPVYHELAHYPLAGPVSSRSTG